MAINHSPAALSVNTLVNDRFRIKRVLGYGGYGNVYLVEDEIVFPGNLYALKESLSSTISEQRQFAREADWLKKLEHPNLPRVLEQFQWNSRPYFVMAYVAGENLEDRVDRQGPLPEDQVLNWMLPICDAVSYLHTQKRPIIHRDIKPGNIIVSKDGRPWLVDFGIAKVLQSGGGRKTTRAARAVSGGYSPLEQYTRGGTDARSDVYALGATFYHLLTGICPPEAPDIASGVARLPEARQVWGRISKQTEQVVMKAMRQKPEERYQSVRDLMNDLPGGRTFTIAPNGTASQPVVTGASSKRPARRAKGVSAPVSPPPAASQAVAVATPPSFTPVQAPPAPPPPAPTYIGVPPAASQAAPQAASQYQPPATLVAQPPDPAASAVLPQPVQGAGASVGAQVGVLLPQPKPVVPAPKPSPARRRRVVLAGVVALLCGLALLATMVMTALYLNKVEQAPIFVLGYSDVVAKPDLGLYALLSVIPITGMLLVILPIAHWVGYIGRGWTYTFLLLVPLAGLASVIIWAARQPSALDSIFLRGFFLPILLFLITWGMSLAWLIRRR
jgi:serine/threonine protein kinase